MEGQRSQTWRASSNPLSLGRHLGIREKHVNVWARAQHPQCFRGILRLDHLEAFVLQTIRDQYPDQNLVLDDQDECSAARGGSRLGRFARHPGVSGPRTSESSEAVHRRRQRKGALRRGALKGAGPWGQKRPEMQSNTGRLCRFQSGRVAARGAPQSARSSGTRSR